jgi:hypothetical protein
MINSRTLYFLLFLAAAADAFSTPLQPSPAQTNQDSTRRNVFIGVATAILAPLPVFARLESVNRPELLPTESGFNVIQVEKFLTTGQAKRMNDLLSALEKDTGFRLRVLCQAYPNTPGLAM